MIAIVITLILMLAIPIAYVALSWSKWEAQDAQSAPFDAEAAKDKLAEHTSTAWACEGDELCGAAHHPPTIAPIPVDALAVAAEARKQIEDLESKHRGEIERLQSILEAAQSQVRKAQRELDAAHLEIYNAHRELNRARVPQNLGGLWVRTQYLVNRRSKKSAKK